MHNYNWSNNQIEQVVTNDVHCRFEQKRNVYVTNPADK